MTSHRGLSAVVGTVFLIAVVMGALSYISYSLNIMGNFSESMIVSESREKDKQSEAFEISSIGLADMELDGVIKNTGEIPIEIKTIWIDEQGSDDVVQKFTLSEEIAPGNTRNIADLIDFTMDVTKGYNLKVVSSRGEVKSIYVNSANQEKLDIQLIAIPDHIPTDFIATILMTVVNNSTNNNILANLTPSTLTCGTGCTVESGPIPTSYDSLESGDIAIFRWTVKLSGNVDQIFDFTGSLQNGVNSNTDSTTIVINEVLESNTAGEALNALGLGFDPFAPDVFIFHTETNLIPASADYQMSLSKPDGGDGAVLSFNDVSDSYTFISANSTVEDIVIPAGIWDASLRYSSAPLPEGLSSGINDIWTEGFDAGHIFHFNENIGAGGEVEDSVQDSTCYGLAHTDLAGIFGASWHVGQGVNNSGAYYFDGSDDYIRIDDSGADNKCNRPDEQLFSITGWFNATDPGDDNMMYLMEKNDPSNDDYVEIVLGDDSASNKGKLYFNFHTTASGSDDLVSCNSGTDTYLDREWHHFAAIRWDTSDNDDCGCRLYVDGVEVDEQEITTCDSQRVKPSNDLFIGSDSGASNEFLGMIDDFMFFVKDDLLSSDVDKIYRTSFGDNAHKMTITIDETDGDGNILDNISTDVSYPLPFSDSFHYSVSDENNYYVGGNYTVSLPQTTLDVLTNSRLQFTMDYDDGLELNLNIDDEALDGVGSNLLSSFLQIPEPLEDLPTYYVYSRASDVDFFAFNGDVSGAWLTYQGTRMIFNATDGSGAYASLLDTVTVGTDTSDVDYNQDSPYIPKNTQATMIFHKPHSTPSESDTPDIPTGVYNVNVFLSGYNNEGVTFLRNINIGHVLVIS